MLKLAEFLKACAQFSRENRVPLILVGAFALKAYGLARMTGDLDLLTGKDFQNQVETFLAGLGFEIFSVSPGFAGALHPLGGRVDLIYVDRKTLEKFLEEARQEEIFPGVIFPVPSPRHLAALKVFAVSNQPERLDREWADLSWMVAQKLVSWKEIRKLAQRYEARAVLRRLDSGV